MGVIIYISKRRREHPTLSLGVMTKHWNSDICDSAAKIFIPLSISHFFFFFLSDQNILTAWQTKFKDTI